MENTLLGMAHMVALVVLLLSSIWDIRFRRIPNLFTIPAVLAGIVLTGFRQPADLIIVLLSCIALFFLGLLPILGKGDLKLIMAVAALCGPYMALLMTGIAAAGVVLLQLVQHPGKTTHSVLITLIDIIHCQFSKIGSDGKNVPFAPYLLFGFLVVLIFKIIMMGGIL